MRGEEGSWLLHRLPLPMQQEVENFKKVNMISREQFDTLTPEPPVDPNQEVPPGPPRFQQGKRQRGWERVGLNLPPSSSGVQRQLGGERK